MIKTQHYFGSKTILELFGQTTHGFCLTKQIVIQEVKLLVPNTTHLPGCYCVRLSLHLHLIMVGIRKLWNSFSSVAMKQSISCGLRRCERHELYVLAAAVSPPCKSKTCFSGICFSAVNMLFTRKPWTESHRQDTIYYGTCVSQKLYSSVTVLVSPLLQSSKTLRVAKQRHSTLNPRPSNA